MKFSLLLSCVEKASFHHAWDKKNLLCDTYLKYLIKILITQDFLKQSDEYRSNTTYENYIPPQRKFFNYNLTICNFAYGSLKYEGDIIDLPPEEFRAEVIPICLTLAEEFAIQFGGWFFWVYKEMTVWIVHFDTCE